MKKLVIILSISSTTFLLPIQQGGTQELNENDALEYGY